jgi:hypothetical protein
LFELWTAEEGGGQGGFSSLAFFWKPLDLACMSGVGGCMHDAWRTMAARVFHALFDIGLSIFFYPLLFSFAGELD